MKRKFKCTVTQTHEVDVTLDDAEITEEWMAEFRDGLYPFHTLREHAEHIAQLAARELIRPGSFVEGYGHINDYDGKRKTDDYNTDITVDVKSEDTETESEEVENV